MGSLDESFDVSNYGKLEVLLLGGTMWYTTGNVLGFSKSVTLGSIDCSMLSTILGNLYIIALWLDIGTEQGY